MAITIPTTELVGLISDVIGFAPAHKDASGRGVLIEWDGGHLTASAHDVLSGGESRWVPGEGEDADYDSEQDATLGVNWGSDEDDRRFRVFVHLDDAKEIVKVFKLAFKYRLTPVTLEAGLGVLYVERARQPWCTAHTMRIETAGEDDVAVFPRIAGMIQASTSTGMQPLFDPLTYNLSRLAQFGAVRPLGLFSLRYQGPSELSAVTIGSTFVGFIYPSSAPRALAGGRIKAATSATVADLLRDGFDLRVNEPGDAEV